jgi:hypothetical protein
MGREAGMRTTRTRPRLLVAAAIVTISCGGIALGSDRPVSAADAEGCSGTVESYGEDGGLLDQVAAPGAGGTPDDPFDIFSDSTVNYQGSTTQVIRNGSWSVDVGGALGVVTSIVEFVSGKSPLSGNIGGSGITSRQGTFLAKDYVAKLKLSGLHRVTVTLEGEGGTRCVATVWVRMHQSFFKSLLAVAGVAFLFLAVLLFWLGAPSWAVENLTFAAFEDQLSPPASGGN